MSSSLRSALRRGGVAVLGGSLLASGLVLGGPTPPSHAHGEADPAPAALAAEWLAGEEAALTGFGGFGWGASIDVALALDAVPGHQADVDALTDALASHIGDYVTGEGFGDTGSTYAGPAAKAAAYAAAVGEDPTAFGGDDLVTRVEGTVQESGRIEDVSLYGDYANVFGQVFAARALTDQGSPDAPAVVDFLLDQQCATGGFRLDFTRTPDGDPNTPDPATDAGCADDAASVPNVDATALAVVTLEPLAASDATIAAALEDAVAWLVAEQRANGSFDDGDRIGPNANSTGLAGNALVTAEQHEPAERAAAWLRSLQFNGTRCDGAARPEIGAVAYDGAELRAAFDGGIVDRAKAARVASQAIPALLAAPDSDESLSFSARPFLNGGGKARIRVTGLAHGEPGCAGVGRFTDRVVGDADGRVVALVRVPNRTGFVPLTVDTADNSVGAEWVALAATELDVDRRARVARGGEQRVVVTGLWSGERVVVRQDGDVVERGRATTRGRFVAVFRAPRATGRHQLKVVGQFADRVGRASYRVG